MRNDAHKVDGQLMSEEDRGGQLTCVDDLGHEERVTRGSSESLEIDGSVRHEEDGRVWTRRGARRPRNGSTGAPGRVEVEGRKTQTRTREPLDSHAIWICGSYMGSKGSLGF